MCDMGTEKVIQIIETSLHELTNEYFFFSPVFYMEEAYITKEQKLGDQYCENTVLNTGYISQFKR